MINSFLLLKLPVRRQGRKITLLILLTLLVNSFFSPQGVIGVTNLDKETLDYLAVRTLQGEVPQVVKYLDDTYLSFGDFEFFRILSPMFVGLFSPDWSEKQAFEPILAAESPTIRFSDDPNYEMSVVVRLKKNLLFSDGSPLTADDVVYSYQAAINQEINVIPIYLNFQNASQIVKIDESTVEFRFEKKTSTYMDQLLQWIISKDGVERLLSSNDPRGEWQSQFYNYLIGAGPYKVAKFDMESKEFILEYNDNWRLTGFPKPEFERIIFYATFEKSRDQIQEEVLQGAYDMVDPIIADYGNSDQLNPGNTSVYDEGFSFMVYSLATNQIHPIWGHTAQLDKFLGASFTNSSGNTFTVNSFWDNISNHQMTEEQRIEAARLIRQAMKIAMDTLSLPDYATSNMLVHANSLFSPSLRGYQQPNESSKNLDTAFSLIQEAFKLAEWNNITLPESSTGIPVDQLWKFFPEWNITAITYETGPITPPYISVMVAVEAFSRIGFHSTLDFHAFFDFFRRIFPEFDEAQYDLPNGLHTPIPLYQDGGYDVVYYFGSSPVFEWKPNYFESYAFYPKGYNLVNYWDEEYDQLMNNYLTEFDYGNRESLSTEIQAKLDTSLPILPVLYQKLAILRNKALSGLDLPILALNLQQWWKLSMPSNTTQKNQKFGDAFKFFRISYPSLGLVILSILALTPLIKRRQPFALKEDKTKS